MSLQSLLSHWRSDVTVGGNITAWETIPARQARTVAFPASLHPTLSQGLTDNQIYQLYSHQHRAWQAIQHGEHVALATDTASGKTLAYNLPVLDYLLKDTEGRALYLFPTKALAQDQLTGIRDLLGGQLADIAPATYDGDTPRSARARIRSKSRLIITNPDMLHIGILPHHTGWEEFFRNLRFVIVDEMHIYRGVFGSHVCNVLRRLQRITKFYGAEVQFMLTSATIGNPNELAEKLIGAPVTLIDDDGSARGPKYFLIYNPPIVDEELGLRASILAECVRLASDLLSYGMQNIIFGRTRRTVELMLQYLRSLEPQRERIRAYRSGYLPEHRREIEHQIRTGQVRSVVATTALELGIDIGGLAATIQAGYPGTIAGTWQQAGRAGRGLEASLSVLVASPSPADQFLARNPDYFFDSSPEQALINPDNELILLKHLQCAVFELPFQHSESFGNLNPAQITEFLEILTQGGTLHKSQEKYFWMGDQYPSAGTSLRSASPNPIILQDQSTQPWTTIGDVDYETSLWMVHPGAIYLHEGDVYQVDDLDLENYTARMRPATVDYFTRPRRETDIQRLEIGRAEATRGCTKSYGDLAVITQVTGYQMVRWESHEKLGFHELSLPATELITAGYWLSIADETIETLRAEGLWNSDRNDYGPNWRSQRQAALARDEYRCRFCGAPEGNQSHHVHHKVPFRVFENAQEANKLDNLITLCPGCHQLAENTVRVRSGLSGLAYTLGQLAPLFLMCDSRDLGVYSDPKAPVADGQPAIVIYEMIPAGIGFSQRLFECHADMLFQARVLIEECQCESGCPSCVGPGGEEGSGGKAEALAILKYL